MKIKTICRHEIVYKNGKSPLAICFTHRRTHKTVSLGISVEAHYWDKNTEMITTDCPERATLQSQIDGTLTGYRKKIQRLEALDIPVNFDTLFDAKPARSVGITIKEGSMRKSNGWNRSAKSTRPPSINTPCSVSAPRERLKPKL